MKSSQATDITISECTARASGNNADAGYKLLHALPSRILKMREVAQRASLLLLSEEKAWNMPPKLVDLLDESSSKGLRETYDIKLPSQRRHNVMLRKSLKR